MKKRLLVILSSLLCLLCSAAFVACDEPKLEESKPSGSYTVTYEAAEGIKYSADNVTTIEGGSDLVFTFEVSVFYKGTPIVTVNGRERNTSFADEDEHIYSCKIRSVSKDVTVSISGVEKAESELLKSGTGTIEAPFLIKEPIDLIEMAEVINAGGENSTMSVLGYYHLENSLDFRGEEIQIIGDGNTQYSFFGGYFNGNGHTISNFKIDTDKEYVGLFGIVQAYDMLGFSGGTIYNLKLSDFTVTSRNTGTTLVCGSLVGQGFGANLTLCEAKNGVVEIYGDQNHFSYAGGLIGLQNSYEYPNFSKIAYCATVNVDVNCNAGSTYVAGGIVGFVYSYEETTVSTVCNSYSTGNVSGSFYAGGIAGWLGNYSAIVNCYSTGNVSAQTNLSDLDGSEEYCHSYAGGIVGMAQNDTAIVDCFVTGKMSAMAQLGGNYAHTGDFAGRIEALNETQFNSHLASVFNCYYAKDGKSDSIDLTKKEDVKSNLYWHEIDWLFPQGSYPVINDVNSSIDSDSETSTIEHYYYTVKLDFGDVIAEGEEEDLSSLEVEIADQYESMAFWYLAYIGGSGGIPSSIYAKDGYVSYGYYFDEARTLAVPYGYVPTRNITLYVGFADYKEVAGTYYIIPQTASAYSDPIKLTISDNGSYECSDAYETHSGVYVYNGKNILFYDARFARYYGVSAIENQQEYTFSASLSDNRLTIFGGIYTDEDGESVTLVAQDNPLCAVKKEAALVGSYYNKTETETTIYTFYADGRGEASRNDEIEEFTYSGNGAVLEIAFASETLSGTVKNGVPVAVGGKALTAADAYRGTWKLDSLSDKYYVFDGAGNWQYLYYGYRFEKNHAFKELLNEEYGTYTVENDGLVLSDGTKISFGADGFVVAKKSGNEMIYGKENSRFGTWNTADGSVCLDLYGMGKNGSGEAKLTFITEQNGKTCNEINRLTYSSDVLADDTLCLFYDGALFGLVSYDGNTGTLIGSVYNATESVYADMTFYRLDEYRGEWIGNDSDPLFEIVDFNGYGSYAAVGVAPDGILLIDGQKVEYTLDGFTLEGYFTYNGTLYSISLDEETNTLTVTPSGEAAIELVRKDVLGDKTFMDETGNEYGFNGKSGIGDGRLTVVATNGETATYRYELTNKDGVVARILNETNAEIGSLTITSENGESSYFLNLNGKNFAIGEKTVFTGKWALSASYASMIEIGTMNLSGKLNGRVPLSVDGVVSVHDAEFEMVDGSYLEWEYADGEYLYAVSVADGQFVLSRYLNWFKYEDSGTDDSGESVWNYSYAMKADLLFGVWTSALFSQEYAFDGMGLCNEVLGYYSVRNIYDTEEDSTEYFYYSYFRQKENPTAFDYVIVTEVGSAWKVVFCDYDTAGDDAYKNEETHRAFTLESVDLSDYDLTKDDYNETV